MFVYCLPSTFKHLKITTSHVYDDFYHCAKKRGLYELPGVKIAMYSRPDVLC